MDGSALIQIPVPRPKRERRLLKRVIALDPGVCVFMTGYDLHGLGVFWGEEDRKRLLALAEHFDRLQGEIDEGLVTPAKRRALATLRWRARNIVTETHRKLAMWLCSNYDIILVPELGVSRMRPEIVRENEGFEPPPYARYCHGDMVHFAVTFSNMPCNIQESKY